MLVQRDISTALEHGGKRRGCRRTLVQVVPSTWITYHGTVVTSVRDVLYLLFVLDGATSKHQNHVFAIHEDYEPPSLSFGLGIPALSFVSRVGLQHVEISVV